MLNNYRKRDERGYKCAGGTTRQIFCAYQGIRYVTFLHKCGKKHMLEDFNESGLDSQLLERTKYEHNDTMDIAKIIDLANVWAG